MGELEGEQVALGERLQLGLNDGERLQLAEVVGEAEGEADGDGDRL